MEVVADPGVGRDRVARPTAGAAAVPVPADAAAPVVARRPVMAIRARTSLDSVNKCAVY